MKAERNYRFSPRAEADLEQIWAYTARTWSPTQADRYVGDIIDAAADLAAGDRVGRDAGDLRPDYLRYAIGRHSVFYRLDPNRLTIIRVLHQSMDVVTHLDQS